MTLRHGHLCASCGVCAMGLGGIGIASHAVVSLRADRMLVFRAPFYFAVKGRAWPTMTKPGFCLFHSSLQRLHGGNGVVLTPDLFANREKIREGRYLAHHIGAEPTLGNHRHFDHL